MPKYDFIPYNKKLVSRSRELRKELTEAEKIFWKEILKSERLSHLKFLRQKPLGNFIVDFYCSKARLAIEIDGDIHAFQKARDRERDNILEQKFGVRVLRYRNDQIIRDKEKIITEIEALTLP
jgi:very-short-patch-repair endonuclease